ncbi:MAG TPA: glycosyltransferase, partial [Candidatus Methylomirabilis sp.]|nr:glycosyltransferase [Candidatus Methylomirabilis sp.]
MSGPLILIPIFNEASTIGDIVTRARRYGAVLVVDDGSSDGSGEAAARAGAEVLRLDRRRGKGAALRAGFAEALLRNAGLVITLDGDGQHDPDEIPRLLEAAAAFPEGLILGGRLAGLPLRGEGAIPKERLNAMRVSGFFINWLTGFFLSDTQSGFRVYPAKLVAAVKPRWGGFIFETEILVRAAGEGWPLAEIPIAFLPPRGRPSRFRPVRDGVAVATYLVCQVLRHWGKAETWRSWRHDPRDARLRMGVLASALSPVLLALTILQLPFRRLGLDLTTPMIRRFYSQDRLAAFRPPPSEPAQEGLGSGDRPREVATGVSPQRTGQPEGAEFDVLVVGGGPAGSTAATF